MTLQLLGQISSTNTSIKTSGDHSQLQDTGECLSTTKQWKTENEEKHYL